MNIDNDIKKTQQQLSTYAQHWAILLNFLIEKSESLKLTEKNKFNFNDLDNNLWMVNGKQKIVCFDSQNFSYACVQTESLDGNTWMIFQPAKNRSINTLISALKKHTIENDRAPYELSDNFLCCIRRETMMDVISAMGSKRENADYNEKLRKKIDAHDKNPGYSLGEFNGNLYDLKYFSFYAQSTANTLMSEYPEIGKPAFPVDIESHDYQLKWSATLYNKTKMDFYEHAFLVGGNGFYWKDGNLVDGSPIYNSKIAKVNVKKIPMGDLERIYPAFDGNYTVLANCPKDITPEWQTARELMIEKLKDFSASLKEYQTSDVDKFKKITHVNGRPYYTIEKLDNFINKVDASCIAHKKEMAIEKLKQFSASLKEYESHDIEKFNSIVGEPASYTTVQLDAFINKLEANMGIKKKAKIQ